MRYFGEVDLVEGGYSLLLRLDVSKNIGQFYAAASDTWKDTKSAFDAPYDTTYYDELTKDQAIEIMARQKAEYYKG